MVIKVKYSIIIPAFNSEEYISKCIDSALLQTYTNFELIIVDDGSTDNTLNIIKSYTDERIKVIAKANGGLSDARNWGVKAASGDYIIFLDSDDYLNKELLETLEPVTKYKPDLVRYQISKIENDKIINYEEEEFQDFTGIEAFEKIVKYHFVEVAWAYAYKLSFWVDNEFSYVIGKYHEDFGLTPYIISKAEKVTSINYLGYNYVTRQNSIMNDVTKIQQKVDDMLSVGLDELTLFYNQKNNDTFMSFVANSLYEKICELKGTDYKMKLRLLNERKIYRFIKKDNMKRYIKSLIIRINPKLIFRKA